MKKTITFDRHRRLRSSTAMRHLVRETHLSVNDLIYPLFITTGTKIKREVSSMPGVFQLSLDYLADEINTLDYLGIKAVLLFGIPDEKDELGSEAYADDGIIQRAIQLIKETNDQMLIIADTCLCEYTSHGHCGVIKNNDVHNDTSLNLIAETAISQARAGAHIIAPSNMMDGFVLTIRKALDDAGFTHVPIMSYAVKYASNFYGPFRDAAESTPQYGNRKTYQMDPANRLEAFREVESDIAEGADFLIVKPALAYLDIVRDIKEVTNIPVITYNVSGEYAMVKAASENGWLDEENVMLEMVTGMKRAGADLIITYFAKDIAKLLRQKGET